MTNQAFTQEHALAQAKAAHPDKGFLWDRFQYINARTKVEVGCPEHGYFSLTYDSLRKGTGCRQCGYTTARKSRAYSTEEFVEAVKDKVKDINGDLFDYSKVDYQNRSTRVTVTCKVHGEFLMHPGNALNNGSGCPSCGTEVAHVKFRRPLDTVSKELVDKLGGDKYSVEDASGYKGSHSYIQMRCATHGVWTMRPNWVLLDRGPRPMSGCPGCSNSGRSFAEKGVEEYIRSLYSGEILTGSRKVIPPFEVDLYLPEQKLAIEYNGLYWHSEAAGKNKEYHLFKTKGCEEEGIRLIQIYEDEWVHRNDIVKARLAHILRANASPESKLFARKLELKKVPFSQATTFFNATHLQGECPGHDATFGLFQGSTLIAAMSFGKPRYSDEGPETAELLRFSSTAAVVGGFSRLLKAYLRSRPDITRVISFSDKRWSQGGVYKTNGFSYLRTSDPGYDYCNSLAQRFNRQMFMKHKMPDLVKKGIFKTFDPAKTEVQNCADNGFWRIWNCGMDLWEHKV
jgi:hypothetical protein